MTTASRFEAPAPEALRRLSRFWLRELTAADLAQIAALPVLAETLPPASEAAATELAVEYQRLFGFNLPPFESVFVDPSAMLMAPATSRVQQLYQAGGWSPPPASRAGAPDHLGLELLALADWLTGGQEELAGRLHREHLALWVPPLVWALLRLKPHPFYAALAELTLGLILASLPPQPLPPQADPFPNLPPPPVYRSSEPEPPSPHPSGEETASRPWGRGSFSSPPVGGPSAPDPEDKNVPPDPAASGSPRRLLKHLLTPRQAGLFLSREELGRLGQRLELPAVMGDRFHLLQSLWREATRYDLRPALQEELSRLLTEAGQEYQAWATEYPAWQPYAAAWQRRLTETETLLKEAE